MCTGNEKENTSGIEGLRRDVLEKIMEPNNKNKCQFYLIIYIRGVNVITN